MRTKVSVTASAPGYYIKTIGTLTHALCSDITPESVSHRNNGCSDIVFKTRKEARMAMRLTYRYFCAIGEKHLCEHDREFNIMSYNGVQASVSFM